MSAKSRRRRAPETAMPRSSSPSHDRSKLLGANQTDNATLSFGTAENDKHRRAQVYGSTCSLERFILNPCQCLYLAIRSSWSCIVRSGSALSRQFLTMPRGRIRADKPIFWILLLLFSCLILGYQIFRRQLRMNLFHPLRPRSDSAVNRIPIQIARFDYSQINDIGGWLGPPPIAPKPSILMPSTKVYNHGGLHIFSLEFAPRFERRIDRNDAVSFHIQRLQYLMQIDLDHITERYRPDEDLDFSHCRRNNWMSLKFPTCNAFHEMNIASLSPSLNVGDPDFDTYYFNHGYYRDAWMLKDTIRDEELVLKMSRYEFDMDHRALYRAERDALVMERLTSSPRIINMYGLCGASVAVEAIDYEVEDYVIPGSGYASQDELDDSKDVQPQNDYSATEKLEMALEVSEAIADLHGYVRGIIVHDDIQLCQWLRTKDDRLVLGDFNRAEVMKWNDSKQQYCKYSNGKGFGNYRAPEEFAAGKLDEKIDIYSHGNNFYAMLTGLWPFYENEDDGVVQGKVIAGQRPFIDDRYRTRSYAEGQLVIIMERCLNLDPDKRPDIFEVIEFLREAVKKNRELGER